MSFAVCWRLKKKATIAEPVKTGARAIQAVPGALPGGAENWTYAWPIGICRLDL